MICCLQGGMGNQMFQYAMAMAISQQLGVDFKLDISRFKNDSMRQYSLGLWAGVDKEIINIHIPNNVVEEDDMPYDPRLISKINAYSSIVGYWQTEKYFSSLKDDLKKIFIPKQTVTWRGTVTEQKIKEAGNRSVFMTIRRTDYVNSDFHGVLSMDYYNKALQMIASRVSDPVIFIFSDEPHWCEQNMKLPYEFHIAGNYDMTTRNHLGREDEELWLMRNCRHAILANSSYSWWGAWLGESDDSMIIAPSKWFLSTEKNPKDIIPNRWIKI